MREYPLKLDKYGITKELYNELKWFCRQYPDKVVELSTVRGGFNSFQRDGMPKGAGASSPTELRAIRALSIQEDVQVVEQAAKDADPTIYRQIINNVASGMRYEEMAVPCGINQFYHARRRFFWHLACRLGKIGD